eukprot:CAMPEP_0175666032 /NCGR_PEP_ID=MMETSP0097-20121207/17368_1 /TAXON_ID=311494 /ORGANISM="Alexandrium monilatum, Strain CCMP3105" /LENGTH=47 /DNA_ID= /DNA_START= /DNA_END= /DNA_ORIENTATION=
MKELLRSLGLLAVSSCFIPRRRAAGLGLSPGSAVPPQGGMAWHLRPS